MLKKMAEPIAKFISKNNRLMLFDILGQDKYKKVKRSSGNFLVQGGNLFKPFFLKVL